MPKKSPLTPDPYLILFLVFASSFIYSLISLIKHWHFQTGLDLAIYNQTLWFNSHFKLPYVTLWPTFGRLVWADHFTPSLSLLTPVYALFPKAEILLIFQSLFFTSGVIPLYLIAKEKTKNLFFSTTLALAYLFFFGSQFALTFDFHAATFGASFLPWIFYFLEKKQWNLFYALVILSLGAKEDMALAILPLGIFMLFQKKWRRMGRITLVLSLAYFIAVIFWVIPSFSHGMVKEHVAPDFPKSFNGWLPFLLSPTKLKTLFLSFASFGFLPLLAPTTWIFFLVHFVYNFLGPSGRGDIYMHYRITLAPILTYSAIYGALSLKRYLPTSPVFKLSGGVLIIAVLSLQYFLHLPFNTLAKKDFYRQKSWMVDNEKLIEMVPYGVSVSTQNHLAPHLSGRTRLFYFPAQEDYVILDLRGDQSMIDFWASPQPEESKKIIADWMKTGKYQVVRKSGEAVLLKKSRL